MCTVSAVFDYFRQPGTGTPQPFTNPYPWQQGGFPAIGKIKVKPKTVIVDGREWDRATLDKVKEALRLLGEVDAALGEPDCEDSAKAEWMREVEERLAALEGGDTA